MIPNALRYVITRKTRKSFAAKVYAVPEVGGYDDIKPLYTITTADTNGTWDRINWFDKIQAIDYCVNRAGDAPFTGHYLNEFENVIITEI